MKCAALTAALILLFLPTAYADECLDKATSQAAMNACAEKSYAASDAALNKLYRQIQQRLNDNDAKKRLVAAQRAWVAFRDAECRFSASDSGGGGQGSVFPMVFNLCLDRLTRRRVEDFKSYLGCGDKGDVSCPVPAASGHKDRQACAEVDTSLSPARKQEYAGLVAASVGKGVKPSQVKIFNVLTSDAWSAVYAGTPVADDGFLFFREINGKKQYKDAWGGMAEPSDRPELIAWAKKIGAPASLATCFADVAIGK